MRAMLVVNPKATTTSELSREVLVRALRSEVNLTVEYTRRRGHAADLARAAVEDHLDVVVTLGGDGTVNEVVNGLLHNGPSEKVPALAVVPGGSTNVFARALGLPRDSIEGTGAILEAMHEGRVRHIGLGRADGRYFTFCAGLGIDADVIRTVERARLRGKVSGPGLYIRSTLARLLLDTERRTPTITLERAGERPDPDIATAIVQNTAPWTYLAGRPINPCPDASFESGLDVMALRGLKVPYATRAIAQLLSGSTRPNGRAAVVHHDLSEFTLRSTRPLGFQLDGDYLGERSEVTFTAVRNALRVYT